MAASLDVHKHSDRNTAHDYKAQKQLCLPVSLLSVMLNLSNHLAMLTGSPAAPFLQIAAI
jgi:hypothetical protein